MAGEVGGDEADGSAAGWEGVDGAAWEDGMTTFKHEFRRTLLMGPNWEEWAAIFGGGIR
jgi:hypothetical protein